MRPQTASHYHQDGELVAVLAMILESLREDRIPIACPDDGKIPLRADSVIIKDKIIKKM